jgi:hypothetical protein
MNFFAILKGLGAVGCGVIGILIATHNMDATTGSTIIGFIVAVTGGASAATTAMQAPK